MSKDKDDLDEFGLHESSAKPTSASPFHPAPPRGNYLSVEDIASLAGLPPQTYDPTRKQPLGGKKRDWQLGFGPTPIPPHGTIVETQQPPCLFRGEKIVVTGDDALVIQELYVGQRSQLPTQQGGIPAMLFKPNALGGEMLMDTCEVSLGITFQIHNPTAMTLTWAATIFGKGVL